jgi:hypothetical protein
MFDFNFHDPLDVAIIAVWAVGVPALSYILMRPTMRMLVRRRLRRDAERSARTGGSPVPDAASCQGCGYSLRALTHFRCPECGKPFDPDDPTTMFAANWLSMALRWLLDTSVSIVRSSVTHWIVVGMIATALVALMNLRGLRFWEDTHIAIPSFVVGWVLWISVIRRTWRTAGKPTGNLVRIGKWTSPMLLLLPLSWSLGTWSCAHGEFVFFGPHLLKLAIRGEDCGRRHPMIIFWDSWMGREYESSERRYRSELPEVKVILIWSYLVVAIIMLRKRNREWLELT